MKSFAYLSAAIYGFLGVAIGAFGAHALEERLTLLGRTETFETGSKYHLLHALLLLALGLVAEHGTSKWLKVAVVSAAVGIFIFSGSLYVLSLTGIGALGAITPFGGLMFLTAWACLFVHFLKYDRKK